MPDRSLRKKVSVRSSADARFVPLQAGFYSLPCGQMQTLLSGTALLSFQTAPVPSADRMPFQVCHGHTVKSNMVYTLCKHMVYMLSITNEHKNELEMRAKPEWKVHFLCFASAKRGSFSIR